MRTDALTDLLAMPVGADDYAGCTCDRCVREHLCNDHPPALRAAALRLFLRHSPGARAEARAILAAGDRAEALLREHLTPYQRRVLRERDGIPVTGSKGGRYWITRGRSSNIRARPAPGAVRISSSWCIVPVHPMPLADMLLAQMLLIQTDEVGFLGIAVWTGVGRRS